MQPNEDDSNRRERERRKEPREGERAPVMEKLTSLLVRPPRMEYDLTTLCGGSDGEFGLRVDGSRRENFFRKDFTLLNSRGIAFECSHYVPMRAVEANIGTSGSGSGNDTPPLLPCVMYVRSSFAPLELSDSIRHHGVGIHSRKSVERLF